MRPGGGFIPKFPVFAKIDVNGQDAHPLFNFLRAALPYPQDDPHSFIQDSKLIIWNPVTRTDIAWNFEKFLVTPERIPFQIYSRNYVTANIAEDIVELINSHQK